MKLSNSLVLAVAALSSANAFAPISMPNRAAFVTSRVAMSEEPAPSESLEVVAAESAMPVGTSYERLGIEESQIAIGIDPSEFLQWIGTKEELVAKFQRDNKGMAEEQADEEVLKFLMDAEMVNAYIKFEKNKVLNPPDLKAEAEQTMSDPKTIATYAAWLVGGAGFGVFRKEFIEPKYASGEWEEIHLGLPSWLPQLQPASSAVEAADSAVPSVADVASTAVDGGFLAMQVVQETVISTVTTSL